MLAVQGLRVEKFDDIYDPEVNLPFVSLYLALFTCLRAGNTLYVKDVTLQEQ